MKPSHRFILIATTPLLFSAISLADPESDPKEIDQNKSAVSQQAIGASWRASEIIGTDVTNTQGDEIGKVNDLVVDLKSGEVLGAIVSSGGTLGVGKTLTLIESDSLSYSTQNKAFAVSLSKEDFEKAPNYDEDSWRNVDAADVKEKLRAARDSIGGNVQAADNTAQNEGDHRKDQPTAENQGNSEGDLKITQQIRSSIMEQELSFNAKNIKIITNEGKVTLRGVVDGANEKETIVRIAGDVVDASAVSDHIEVKNK